jgi:hypothetical protein
MNNETFRTRLLALLQKSRKAVRVYTSIGSGSDITSPSNEYSSLQIEPWRQVNMDLSKSLTLVLGSPNKTTLATAIYELRDRYYNEWRLVEAEVHKQHKNLISAVEKSDFVSSANISRSLIEMKARLQVLQAAHHEINEAIEKSHVSQPVIDLAKVANVVTLSDSTEVRNPIVRQAKVIPLRKKAS